jgi:hypothetical protein
VVGLALGPPLASGGSIARAVASGKRIFISRMKPSSVSTLAAILAIRANSVLLEDAGLLAMSNACLAICSVLLACSSSVAAPPV